MVYIGADGSVQEGTKPVSYGPKGIMAFFMLILNMIVAFFQSMNPFSQPAVPAGSNAASAARFDGSTGSGSGSSRGGGGNSRNIGRGYGGGSINQFRPAPPPPSSCPGGNCPM